MKTVILVFLLSLLSIPESEPEVSLVIKDIRSNKGELEVAIFRPEDNFPGKPSYRRLRIPARDSATELKFSLPAGTYAIAVFHDEDESGDLNKSFIGVPKEAVGMSNGKGHGLSRPNFGDAAFELSKDTSVSVDLVHY